MQTPHVSRQPSVGLGLRRGLLKDLQAAPAGDFDFLEVAPENWIGVGGAHGAALRELAERYPLSCHGLSLSLGGPALRNVRHAGGGSRSTAWMTLRAQALRVPQLPAWSEEAAAGAARLAWRSLGHEITFA